MHLKWALAITGIGLALGLALAQQPQDIPTINVSVNVVNILCSVRDGKGALLPNLTKDDFTVTEEGKPQDIRYFTHETDLPLTLGLLVDVSGSERNMIEIEKRAADQFFGKVLRKQDMAFLMSFGSEAELLQDSTNSVVLLRRGLDNLKLRTGATGPLPSPVPTINQPRGTILFDAVYLAATEQLRTEVGRKAIVLITDGDDQGSRVKLTEAIEAAQKSDLIIYSILYYDPSFYRSQGIMFSPGEADLRRMSEETGGHMFRVDRRTTLESVFQEIQDEMRTQYSIGYAAPGNTAPGTYRRVEVRTKQKGLKVQARKGYYSAKPEG
jgi:VWFA-related protein